MYVAKVMTMGDMSPAGLSHAYYNSPDGEPEDVVVGYIGFYETLEELEANIDADIYSFEKEVGCSMEDGGGWVEVVFEGEEDDDEDDYSEH